MQDYEKIDNIRRTICDELFKIATADEEFKIVARAGDYTLTIQYEHLDREWLGGGPTRVFPMLFSSKVTVMMNFVYITDHVTVNFVEPDFFNRVIEEVKDQIIPDRC